MKAEIDTYKEKADKLDKAEKDLEKANAKINELSKEDAYKVKYDALKEDFDSFKKQIETEKTNDSKKTAYKALLKEIGIADKRIEAVAKLADIEKITLDKDGKIEGADDLKKALAEEWADFIVKDETKGANTSTPPGGNGVTKTKEEIMAIKDTAERQQAMLENKSLFIK